MSAERQPSQRDDAVAALTNLQAALDLLNKARAAMRSFATLAPPGAVSALARATTDTSVTISFVQRMSRWLP